MNDKVRTILFNFSALLVLAGALLYFFHFLYAPYLFAVGTAGVAIAHFTVPYKDLSLRRKRLQHFNVLASGLMIAASALMFKGQNEWIICLSIAAIFQTYAAFVKTDD